METQFTVRNCGTITAACLSGAMALAWPVNKIMCLTTNGSEHLCSHDMETVTSIVSAIGLTVIISLGVICLCAKYHHAEAARNFAPIPDLD